MKWRTDKPTADIIVVFLKGSCYPQVLEYDKEKQCYLEEHNSPVNIQDIAKWADLEEEETVTDCNELEEEVKKYINDNWEYDHPNENAPLYLYDFSDKDLLDAARHFAKWGADHTFTHHETDESLQEAVTHQMEDDQTIDDYVRKGLDEVCLRYAELGANWQKEQDHDACYQCEKNYDNVFYKGEQHAIAQMKEDAIERTVKEDAGGYPYIDETELYDYEKDEPTAKKGDKIKVYIFKDNKEQ